MAPSQPSPSIAKEPQADFLEALAALTKELEALLSTLFAQTGALAPHLGAAMSYAATGGGKRLRPFLCVAAADLFAVPRAQSLRVGAAIELLHCYSLVHDDLPAMDNSPLRRGKPSLHCAFDEATAILAGDALLTETFAVLAAQETSPDPEIRCCLIAGLAEAAGGTGMVGGQALDMAATGKHLSLEELTKLHRAKTGALLAFSLKAGAILGQAGRVEEEALVSYGQAFGLAFQIIDDLLDSTATSEAIGKPTGQDAAAGKNSFVTHLGIAGAAQAAQSSIQEALAVLDSFGEKAELLRGAAWYLNARLS